MDWYGVVWRITGVGVGEGGVALSVWASMARWFRMERGHVIEGGTLCAAVYVAYKCCFYGNKMTSDYPHSTIPA